MKTQHTSTPAAEQVCCPTKRVTSLQERTALHAQASFPGVALLHAFWWQFREPISDSLHGSGVPGSTWVHFRRATAAGTSMLDLSLAYSESAANQEDEIHSQGITDGRGGQGRAAGRPIRGRAHGAGVRPGTGRSPCPGPPTGLHGGKGRSRRQPTAKAVVSHRRKVTRTASGFPRGRTCGGYQRCLNGPRNFVTVESRARTFQSSPRV
jgi:hypothetical protein